MKFAEKIFERATVKGVADYLLYGMIPDRDGRSYGTRLDDADLAYEKVARQYNEDGVSMLLSAANELADENASVYMELGMQAGFLLITDLFQTICREKNHSTNNRVSDISDSQEEQNPDTEAEVATGRESEADINLASGTKGTVLQQFIRNRMDTVLEDTLRKDRVYQKSKEKAEATTGRLEKDMFTSEQWKPIDNALEDSNASASEYGRAAYQQGLSDALELFTDIFLRRRI